MADKLENGPWKIKPCPSGGWLINIGGGYEFHVHDADCALLISKAPEMKLALKEVCSRCQSGYSSWVKQDSCKKCPIKKALNKTEGE